MEIATCIEGIFPDTCQRLREVNGTAYAGTQECSASDSLQSASQNYGAKIDTVLEYSHIIGTILDCGTVVGDGYRSYSRIVEHLVVDFGQGRRQGDGLQRGTVLESIVVKDRDASQSVDSR